ncbi:MAG: hypothetical protein ABIX37_09530 [Gammaproteobacteria bacterium]
MEQDLLRYLLAAFPKTTPGPRLDDDYLVIHGYRVPFDSPVDDVMLDVMAEFRRRGFSRPARGELERV